MKDKIIRINSYNEMNSIIELQNISLYREKTQILKNISWNIKKGAHWALIGPNGAGKTSLLKIISGNLWPSSGKVKVLGKEFGKNGGKKAKGLLKLMSCDYIIGRSFSVISQGEKQKVLIARALMAEPLILLLDEPCIGLDIKARENLLNSISKICKETKTAIIYVTHHIEEIIEEIDNAFLLKGGEVFMHGKKKNILDKENLSKFFK